MIGNPNMSCILVYNSLLLIRFSNIFPYITFYNLVDSYPILITGYTCTAKFLCKNVMKLIGFSIVMKFIVNVFLKIPTRQFILQKSNKNSVCNTYQTIY